MGLITPIPSQRAIYWNSAGKRSATEILACHEPSPPSRPDAARFVCWSAGSPAAYPPVRCSGNGGFRGRWRHPPGRRWREKDHDSGGLYRRPGDGAGSLQQARQALQQLLPVGSTVTLKAQTKDRYGRTVAEVFTQNGANAGLILVQQGNAFAYRQYLKQGDKWAYLDREKLAEPVAHGVWRSAGGSELPWDFRAARRGVQSQPAPSPQRPVNLTIINGGPTSGNSSGRRRYCRNVGSWERAQQLLREGHTY